MNPDPWMPGAQRHPLPDTAPTDHRYPPRAIAHITWDARPVTFAAMVRYFLGADGSTKAPHLLWDPIGGTFAQFYPATSRSKSVRDSAGGTRTNRAGAVCLQIEALLSPGQTTYQGRVCRTLLDTPCAGWDRLQAWASSWGVPTVWPMGVPDWSSQRDEHVWETRGGWYGHSQVPENTHSDPGPWPAFTTATGAPGILSTSDGSINLMASQYDTLIAKLDELHDAVKVGDLASTLGHTNPRTVAEILQSTKADADTSANGIPLILAALVRIDGKLSDLIDTVKAAAAVAAGPAT